MHNDLADQYNIAFSSEKSFFFGVTDNGATDAKAAKDVAQQGISCVAHTLNLVSKSVLDNAAVAIIIQRARKMVAFFKYSNKANDALTKIQGEQLNDEVFRPLKVKQDVVTR